MLITFVQGAQCTVHGAGTGCKVEGAGCECTVHGTGRPAPCTQHPNRAHGTLHPARQYTPTVVVDAKPRYGRTPLTPSHGYLSYGSSRSPSSRSRKPGTN